VRTTEYECGHHNRIGREEEAGENRPDGRPAGQLRLGRRDLSGIGEHRIGGWFRPDLACQSQNICPLNPDERGETFLCGFPPLKPTGRGSYRRGARRFSAIRRDAMGTSMRPEEK
jgi:hypothetical protein